MDIVDAYKYMPSIVTISIVYSEAANGMSLNEHVT
jgi:hypothetical protein